MSIGKCIAWVGVVFILWLWTWFVLLCNGAGSVFRWVDRWVDAIIDRLVS